MKKESDFSITDGSWIATIITGAVAIALGALTLAAFPTGFYLNLLPGPFPKFVVVLTWANLVYLINEGNPSDLFLALAAIVALAVAIEPHPEMVGTAAIALRCLLGVCAGLCTWRWSTLVFSNLEHRVRSTIP